MYVNFQHCSLSLLEEQRDRGNYLPSLDQIFYKTVLLILGTVLTM